MRYLLVLSAALILFACGKKDEAQTTTAQQEHQMAAQAKPAQMAEEQIIYYTCPMESHKEVHSDKPGKCPECGMELVAAVVTTNDRMEFYGCPMEAHSYMRSDQPGTCPDCGMELKPMRLVKD